MHNCYYYCFLGFWGFIVLGALLVPFYWIPAYPPFSENPRNVLEDTPDGLVQLYNNGLLFLAVLGKALNNECH